MLRCILSPAGLALFLGLVMSASVQAQYGGGGYGPGPSPGPKAAPAPSPAPVPAPAPLPAPTPGGGGGGGQTITISPWTIPGGPVPPFGTRQAKVGDTAVFVFEGLHGLFEIPSDSCPQEFVDVPPLKQISAPTNNGRAEVTFDAPGDRFFACPVPGHCPAGMLIHFVVTA